MQIKSPNKFNILLWLKTHILDKHGIEKNFRCLREYLPKSQRKTNVLRKKHWKFSLVSRKKAKMPTTTTSIWHYGVSPGQQTKRTERNRKGGEGEKLPLFTADMIVYIENPKEYSDKLSELNKK